tara:strand:- start:669 stop:1358 length:690 start_codon:yes stop_codon:yes gene_type:complete
MLDYLQNSYENAALSNKEFSIFGKDIIFVKDSLPEHVDLKNVISKVERILPPWVVSEIDMIYIGHFEIFDQNNFNSVYENGAIYVTNDQDNEEDMVDDIVHEAAHAIEVPYGHIIYEDGRIEKEFLNKRVKLFQLLKTQGYEIVDARNLFLNTKFNKRFDDFLYKEIGYDLLDNLLIGVFIRPYAATSINEYFSTGFVEYYMGDRAYLLDSCPKLYSVISDLEDIENES